MSYKLDEKYARLSELKEEQENILQEIKRLENPEPELPIHKVAIYLHDNFCSGNHTDGCGWGYEICDDIHDWKAFAHTSWLRFAEQFVKKFPHTID